MKRFRFFRQYMLARCLRQVELHDTDYEQRYPLVFEALHWALRCGYKAGFRIDATEPLWPVAFIELPTGQVSWHMPQFPFVWDGHSTAEKYDRIGIFVLEYGA